MTPPRCPYCGQQAALVPGRVVYPRREDLSRRRYFYCEPCGAWTGQNAYGQPSGVMANAERRKARAAAHAAFDPLWRSGMMTRNGAYRWLSEELGIPKGLLHIGNMDEAQCARVVAAVRNMEPRAAE